MKRLDIEKRAIVIGLAGSQSYRTNIAGSDTEYRGVTIGLKNYYFGFENFQQKDKGWDQEPGIYSELDNAPDSAIYEVRRYFNLAMSANPNILETMFLEPDQYLVVSPEGQLLINNRQLFLSKKLKHSFCGYAFQQIKRMESHRKWLLNPPIQKPRASDFGLADEIPLTKEELNAFLEFLYILVKDRIEYLEEVPELYELLKVNFDFKGVLKQNVMPPGVLDYVSYLTRSTKDFISLLHKTQTYRQELSHWKAYEEWKLHRNRERAKLEEKCGFDSKNVSHAIRLLTMGLEALKDQTLYVNREKAGDADYLRSIRLGEVSYEAVKEKADSLFAELETAYENTTLPKNVNHKKINDLCVDIVSMKGFY